MTWRCVQSDRYRNNSVQHADSTSQVGSNRDHSHDHRYSRHDQKRRCYFSLRIWPIEYGGSSTTQVHPLQCDLSAVILGLCCGDSLARGRASDHGFIRNAGYARRPSIRSHRSQQQDELCTYTPDDRTHGTGSCSSLARDTSGLYWGALDLLY